MDISDGHTPGQSWLGRQAPVAAEPGMSQDTDATVRVVKPIRTDHRYRVGGGGTPRLGGGPSGDELLLSGRDRRSVKDGHDEDRNAASAARRRVL